MTSVLETEQSLLMELNQLSSRLKTLQFGPERKNCFYIFDSNFSNHPPPSSTLSKSLGLTGIKSRFFSIQKNNQVVFYKIMIHHTITVVTSPFLEHFSNFKASYDLNKLTKGCCQPENKN